MHGAIAVTTAEYLSVGSIFALESNGQIHGGKVTKIARIFGDLNEDEKDRLSLLDVDPGGCRDRDYIAGPGHVVVFTDSSHLSILFLERGRLIALFTKPNQ